METKICFRCSRRKPLTEFYVHSEMKDGHLNKCKECTKADANKHRQDNLEHVRRYDRERSQDPERKKAKQLRYRKVVSTEEGKKKLRSYFKRWQEKNWKKRAVHILVGSAIRSGRIIPESCQQCRAERADAHHEDYDKPFDITWLCKSCHGKRHRELNEQKRNL